MKISYAITVKDELLEIQRLIPLLIRHKRVHDEVVILFDDTNGDSETLQYLLKFNTLPNVQVWRGIGFNGHFGEWKNRLTDYCTGDFIFQIDADEYISEFFIENLHIVLDANPIIDVYFVPRINTVTGLTSDHITKWGWQINDKGWVNFPDYQKRIYRRNPDIRWKNKVHETLEGYRSFSTLPTSSEEWCIHHPKTIEKQERQNTYYETL